MLGWRCCKQNRDTLRTELAAFALKHIGNRAFVAMLFSLGELTSHLGLFELDSAGAELLAAGAELVVGAAKESHHGDGGGPLVDPATAEATGICAGEPPATAAAAGAQPKTGRMSAIRATHASSAGAPPSSAASSSRATSTSN